MSPVVCGSICCICRLVCFLCRVLLKMGGAHAITNVSEQRKQFLLNHFLRSTRQGSGYQIINKTVPSNVSVTFPHLRRTQTEHLRPDVEVSHRGHLSSSPSVFSEERSLLGNQQANILQATRVGNSKTDGDWPKYKQILLIFTRKEIKRLVASYFRVGNK
jgi:hypothetical protein